MDRKVHKIDNLIAREKENGIEIVELDFRGHEKNSFLITGEINARFLKTLYRLLEKFCDDNVATHDKTKTKGIKNEIR